MIYVMILWLSSYGGSPTTIQGFSSLDACQKAAVVLHEKYYPNFNSLMFNAQCVELPKGD